MHLYFNDPFYNNAIPEQYAYLLKELKCSAYCINWTHGNLADFGKSISMLNVWGFTPKIYIRPCLKVTPESYAEQIKEFKAKYERFCQSLEFFCISSPDQKKTWNKLAAFKKSGVKTIPIIKFGVGDEHIIKAVSEYELIAVEDIPNERSDILLEWMSLLFKIIYSHWKKTLIMPRVHLSEIDNKALLEYLLYKFPVYSADFTWLKYAARHTFRFEINSHLRIEQEITKLWQSRGINFYDL